MTNRNEIEQRVLEILIDILDVKAEQVRPQAALIRDLGASSIDLVEISTALQNLFDIEVDDVEASRLVTVDDAISFVELSLRRKETSIANNAN